MELTEKQEEIYRFIQSYQGQHGFPPSQNEIALKSGLGRATVREHLKAIERKGFITRKNSRHMIEITA